METLLCKIKIRKIKKMYVVSRLTSLSSLKFKIDINLKMRLQPVFLSFLEKKHKYRLITLVVLIWEDL